MKQILSFLRGLGKNDSPNGRPLHQPGRSRLDITDMIGTRPIYAVGDIHGCLSELLRVEELIRNDMAADRAGLVILLGDYVDRGPNSAMVLEHLATPSADGFKRLALCGNHDEGFLRFIRQPDQYMRWIDLGGRETLVSYGIDPESVVASGGVRRLKRLMDEMIPESHIRFLESLPVNARIGDFLFVHAGIRPGIPLHQQTEEDMMWIREPFLSEGPELPLMVVHGHSPEQHPVFGNGRIGIDTGAFLGGRLAVLKIRNGATTVL